MKSKVINILLAATLASTALLGAKVAEVKASETNVYTTVVWVTKQEDGKEKILKNAQSYDSSKPETSSPGTFSGYQFDTSSIDGTVLKHYFKPAVTVTGDKVDGLSVKPDILKPFKDTVKGTSWLVMESDGTSRELKAFLPANATKKAEEVEHGTFKGYRFVETKIDQGVRKHWFVKDDSVTGTEKVEEKLTGWQYIADKWYFFDQDGMKKTGWVNDGSWYYLAADGSMQTGWKFISGKWYYLNSAGSMQTGWLNQGGKWYYLYSDGAMATGWAKVDGVWYYLNTSGALVTGWFQAGSKWYYAYSSGALAVNTTINGYTLNANGEWV